MSSNYQLRKQFRTYPPGTAVKVHIIDGPVATISIVGLPKQYLVPANYIKKSESVGNIVTATNVEVSPGRPLIASSTSQLARLDELAITYTPDQMANAVRFTCYCGASSIYYPFEAVRAQPVEREALNKAIAACQKCAERHSHSSQKPSYINEDQNV
jgi:hypothetical protein